MRWGDQDPNRHVNNTAICQYVEEARVNLRERCFSQEVRRAPVAFVVASFHIRFLRPITFPGEVRTGTVVTRLGRTSYTLVHGAFFNAAIAALGRTVTVVCDRETGAPTAIPAAIRQELMRLKTDLRSVVDAAEAI